MSNRDSAADEAAFIELIDRETEDQIDPGVRIFDVRIAETEEFINSDDDIDSSRPEAAIDGLDEEWKFHNGIATLTGRVYVSDPISAELMVQVWGAPSKDVDGCSYFMVEGAELRSRGVVRGPHDYMFQPKDRAHHVRFGYGFSLPNSQAPFDQFVVYPGEVSQHVYDQPSSEAIDIRLHRDWPEAMELVDKLITPDERETQRLPRRLAALTHRLQDDLVASADFREWLAMYIDERVNFDDQWSIALTMRGVVTFVDEDNDYLSLEIKNSHTEHCFKPEVIFESKRIDGQNIVEAALVANFPNPIDQNCSDTCIVPVSSIESLRSTRRTISLVQVAMMSLYANEKDVQTTHVVTVPEPAQRMHETAGSLEGQRKLDDLLKELTVVTRKVRRNSFSSHEAAELASDKLCANFTTAIKSLSNYNYPLYIRGDGVSLPNIQIVPEADNGSFIISLNKDTPTGSPSAAMEVIGYLEGVYPGVEVIQGDKGEWYSPLPQLVVVIDSIPVQIGQGPVPAIIGDIKKRALVRADQFGSVRPAQLEMVDDFRAAFLDFKHKYPTSKMTSVISRIKRAESALMKDEEKPTALSDIEILKSFARELKRSPNEALEAMEVVTRMLKHATALVSGDIYINGQAIHEDELYCSIEAIVESVPNHPETGAAFAVQINDNPDEAVAYIPLNSISAFLY